MHRLGWWGVLAGLMLLVVPVAAQPLNPAEFLLPPEAPPPKPSSGGIRQTSGTDAEDLPPPPPTREPALQPIRPRQYPDDYDRERYPPRRESADRDYRYRDDYDRDYRDRGYRDRDYRDSDYRDRYERQPPLRPRPRPDYRDLFDDLEPEPTPERRAPANPVRQGDFDDYQEYRRQTSVEPAARLGGQRGIRRVSAEDVERPPPKSTRQPAKTYDLIEYLTEGYDGPTERSRSRGLFDRQMPDFMGDPQPEPLRSDTAFETFVSPVTNPFLFEDPRSLTEIRPIFIYQRIPNNEPIFNGGNLTYIGVQGRLALTNRFSLVVHKFGGQGINPSSNININSDSFGLSELWLGPKYTFIRDTESGSLLAGGAQFQVPIGSSSVFQNTGNLSIVPYVTYGQNFLRSRNGSFHGLVGTGYSFSTNDQRSDYYYLSAHLDYDVGNLHRFYPLAELNWFYYTTDGTSYPWRMEGRDLINFGSMGKGSSLLTGALGGRVKLTKTIELGGAFEIPFAGNRDLFSNRWTFDLIWRY